MERKKNYVSQLLNHTETYKKIIIAECSNVGSNQLQAVRTALRGKAIILMGKNSLMRKGLKTVPKLAGLVGKIKGNVCLIFTNSDLKEVRDIVNSNKRPAAVKAGQISPKKVVIPAQNTGMEPTKTSFFQALNIQTKIQKGTVEIVSDSTILEIGQKVSASQAALLQLLNMKPFEYGLLAQQIYDDGVLYSPDVLDTSAEDMSKLLNDALTNITGISVETGYPTTLSVSSLLLKGFKETVAISLGTNYDFGETAKFKEALKNPTKVAPKVEEKKVEEKKDDKKDDKKPATKVEEKEPSDADMGLGLFGDE